MQKSIWNQYHKTRHGKNIYVLTKNIWEGTQVEQIPLPLPLHLPSTKEKEINQWGHLTRKCKRKSWTSLPTTIVTSTAKSGSSQCWDSLFYSLLELHPANSKIFVLILWLFGINYQRPSESCRRGLLLAAWRSRDGAGIRLHKALEFRWLVWVK